jgi:putative FmdB family regulatory protein
MPIYAYRCEHCGHAKDVLQKLSDPVLSTCPACGTAAFRKQVTAAGFQLKGSGWYVTDFRGGNGAAAKADANGAQPVDGARTDTGKIDTGKTDTGKSDIGKSDIGKSAPAAAASGAGDAGASAGGCGTSCACH